MPEFDCTCGTRVSSVSSKASSSSEASKSSEPGEACVSSKASEACMQNHIDFTYMHLCRLDPSVLIIISNVDFCLLPMQLANCSLITCGACEAAVSSEASSAGETSGTSEASGSSESCEASEACAAVGYPQHDFHKYHFPVFEQCTSAGS